MKHPTDNRAKIDSWFLAAVFLLGFCYLGFFTHRFAQIFEGMRLPLTERFIISYGPIAFPLVGVFAAASFVLSALLSRRSWLQWMLIAFFALVGIWSFGLLVRPRFNMAVSQPANRTIHRMGTSHLAQFRLGSRGRLTPTADGDRST